MALHGDTAIGRSEDYAAEVERLVTPTLEAMGYDLVRLLLAGKRGLTLQIMAERKDRREMTVDDCAEISRTVSAVLDVEDPIPGNYTLEVSSPGLERPLVRKDDFVRFAGMEAKVESTQMIDGRKRFRGRIEGVRGDDVVISGDWGEAAVPLAAIQRAKLVLTDDVIAAELEKRGR